MNDNFEMMLIQLKAAVEANMKNVCNRLDKIEYKLDHFPCATQLEKCESRFGTIKWGQMVFVWIAVIGIISSVIAYNFSGDNALANKGITLQERIVKVEEAVKFNHGINGFKHIEEKH